MIFFPWSFAFLYSDERRTIWAKNSENNLHFFSLSLDFLFFSVSCYTWSWRHCQ